MQKGSGAPPWEFYGILHHMEKPRGTLNLLMKHLLQRQKVVIWQTPRGPCFRRTGVVGLLLARSAQWQIIPPTERETLFASPEFATLAYVLYSNHAFAASASDLLCSFAVSAQRRI